MYYLPFGFGVLVFTDIPFISKKYHILHAKTLTVELV